MQGLLRKYVKRRKEMTNLRMILVCCCKASASEHANLTRDLLSMAGREVGCKSVNKTWLFSDIYRPR